MFGFPVNPQSTTAKALAFTFVPAAAVLGIVVGALIVRALEAVLGVPYVLGILAVLATFEVGLVDGRKTGLLPWKRARQAWGLALLVVAAYHGRDSGLQLAVLAAYMVVLAMGIIGRRVKAVLEEKDRVRRRDRLLDKCGVDKTTRNFQDRPLWLVFLRPPADA